ncbi:Endonuclease/exonuclease/phosphatase [Entophlyctis helioformis]|nr:Endonuclease/exonuclease/phosphatase [Entophlyctis helioformis]
MSTLSSLVQCLTCRPWRRRRRQPRTNRPPGRNSRSSVVTPETHPDIQDTHVPSIVTVSPAFTPLPAESRPPTETPLESSADDGRYRGVAVRSDSDRRDSSSSGGLTTSSSEDATSQHYIPYSNTSVTHYGLTTSGTRDDDRYGQVGNKPSGAGRLSGSRKDKKAGDVGGGAAGSRGAPTGQDVGRGSRVGFTVHGSSHQRGGGVSKAMSQTSLSHGNDGSGRSRWNPRWWKSERAGRNSRAYGPAGASRTADDVILHAGTLGLSPSISISVSMTAEPPAADDQRDGRSDTPKAALDHEQQEEAAASLPVLLDPEWAADPTSQPSRSAQHSHQGSMVDGWRLSISKSLSDMRKLLKDGLGRNKSREDLGISDTPKAEKLQIYVVTWNMNGRLPRCSLASLLGDPQLPPRITPAVTVPSTQPQRRYDSCHLLAITVQECQRGVESAIKKDWERIVQDYIGDKYALLRCESLAGIHLMVFVRKDIARNVTMVASSRISTGIGNVLGNKGSVAIGLLFNATSVLFVGSHFAAHQDKVASRNRDYERTNKEMSLPGFHPRDAAIASLSDRFDHVFWAGDFNYRVNGTRALADTILENRRYEVLFNNDQLQIEMRRQNVFRGFSEPQITFQPTYKFQVDPDCITPVDGKLPPIPTSASGRQPQSSQQGPSSAATATASAKTLPPLAVAPLPPSPPSPTHTQSPSPSPSPNVPSPSSPSSPSAALYGYDPRSDRIPSWTDRILFKSRRVPPASPPTVAGHHSRPSTPLLHPIIPRLYNTCMDIGSSDHKPVYALFVVDLDVPRQ